MFKKYYALVKPGIVYGNAFTTFAAFLFASRWHFAPFLLIATLLGISFVIASACVFNNFLDRDIDRKMARTKDRALASGAIPVWSALLYGTVLGICGLVLLHFYVNNLTALIAFLGFVFYVIIYGWAKRASHWGTVVGSISGSVPIVVGYTAVTDKLDMTALILFLILALWQMPHFYAIAIYRFDEYAAAGIPVLPIKKGMRKTKIYIVSYILAFVFVAPLLTLFGHAGHSYLAAVVLFGLVWLWRGLLGFRADDNARWARKLFFVSLIVLVAFSVALSLATVLP